MADKVLLDHAGTVLAAGIVHAGNEYYVQLRLFTAAGLSDFMVTTDEAAELIELLQTAVAKDAEERLKKKEPQAGQVFPGFAVTVGSR